MCRTGLQVPELASRQVFRVSSGHVVDFTRRSLDRGRFWHPRILHQVHWLELCYTRLHRAYKAVEVAVLRVDCCISVVRTRMDQFCSIVTWVHSTCAPCTGLRDGKLVSVTNSVTVQLPP
jgi:hypothetical protein